MTSATDQLPQLYYRLLLKDELSRRQTRNPRYSLRAFARALGVDPSDLSNALTGKRSLPFKAAQKVAKKLALNAQEEALFLDSVLEERKVGHLSNANAALREQLERLAPEEVDNEIAQAMSEWYYSSILELTFCEDFCSDVEWIANALELSMSQTEGAIKRLLRLGLLAWEGDRLVKTKLHITTKDKHLTAPALRKVQGQLLERAKLSLEQTPIEERSTTSMTMSIDPEKLPLAKAMIEEFSQYLCKALESGRRRQVYNLVVSLHPEHVLNRKGGDHEEAQPDCM